MKPAIQTEIWLGDINAQEKVLTDPTPMGGDEIMQAKRRVNWAMRTIDVFPPFRALRLRIATNRALRNK